VGPSLFEVAKQRLEEGVTRDASHEGTRDALVSDEASSCPGNGLCLAPWECDVANGDKIKEECEAAIRCHPLDANQQGSHEGKKCFCSGEDATHMALSGRAS